MNGILCQSIAAKPHGSKHMYAFYIVLGPFLVAAEHQPAGTETGNPVGLGQAVEGYAQNPSVIDAAE